MEEEAKKDWLTAVAAKAAKEWEEAGTGKLQGTCCFSISCQVLARMQVVVELEAGPLRPKGKVS